MAKFLQYNIDELLDFTKKSLSRLQIDKKYSKDEIKNIFSSVRDYQSKKTKTGYFGETMKILMESDESSYKLNALSYLLKKNLEDDKLLIEIIFLYLYKNIEIFRIECNILSVFLDTKGSFSKRDSSFKAILIKKTKKYLFKKEDQGSIHNMEQKINRTFKNLITLGVITEFFKDDEEKEKYYEIHHYRPNLYLFLVLILQEFQKRKIGLSEIENSKTRKLFFMNKNEINDYLIKASEYNILTIENRAGLNQIDLLEKDPIKLINDFQ